MKKRNRTYERCAELRAEMVDPDLHAACKAATQTNPLNPTICHSASKGRHKSKRRSKRPLTASPVRDERKKFLTSASTELLHVEQKGEPQRPSATSHSIYGADGGVHRNNLSPHAFHTYAGGVKAKTTSTSPATSDSRVSPSTVDVASAAAVAATAPAPVAAAAAAAASMQRPGTAPNMMMAPSFAVNTEESDGRKVSLREQNSHLQAEIRRLQEGFVSRLRGPKRFTSGGGFRTAAGKGQDGGKGSSLHLRNAMKKIKEDNRELERNVQSLTIELREARDELARASSYYTKEKRDHRKREDILLKEIEGKASVEKRALESQEACRVRARLAECTRRRSREYTHRSPPPHTHTHTATHPHRAGTPTRSCRHQTIEGRRFEKMLRNREGAPASQVEVG